MIKRLHFIVKNNTEKTDFFWRLNEQDNTHADFCRSLSELYGGVKLPSSVDLAFISTSEGIVFHTSITLNINGVGKNEKLLKKGDMIAFGPLRLIYQAVIIEDEQEDRPEPDRGLFDIKKLMKPLPAAIAAAVTAAVIIAGCMTSPKTAHPEKETAGTAAPNKTEAEVPADSAETTENIMEAAATETLGTEELLVIAPGEEVPKMPLDILFIHAHPDDESLDFGCLMALTQSSGLKTGLLTLTDGESGLDTYPDRPVTDFYPDHQMAGRELAAVRSRELSNAAEILGVDLLIRAGLKNNPYNSISDELAPEKVLEQWGGKEKLKSYISDIIIKTSAVIVVSPEKPGKAREHFEHEAAGLLVHEVLSDLKEEGGLKISHITSIDPRQNDLYDDKNSIEAYYRQIPLRDIQIDALSAHKTQNDSINVGIDFISTYDQEYYKVQQWSIEASWDEWVRELTDFSSRS